VKVHSVLSNLIAGFGYENGTLRVVFKNGKAYDYINVTQEDAGIFAQGLGKSLNHIKSKYECKPLDDYFSEIG